MTHKREREREREREKDRKTERQKERKREREKDRKTEIYLIEIILNTHYSSSHTCFAIPAMLD